VIDTEKVNKKYFKLWKKWWPAIPIGGALASMALTFHRMFAVSYFAPIDLGRCGYTPSVQTYDFYQVI
jgi:hypothetical protein